MITIAIPFVSLLLMSKLLADQERLTSTHEWGKIRFHFYLMVMLLN